MFRVKERDMRAYELALQGAYTKRSNVDIAVIKFQNYDDDTKEVYDMASITMRDHDGAQFRNGRGDLLFYTSTGCNQLVERMRITPDGNVGIGERDPQFALDVGGTVRAVNWANLPVAKNGVLGVTHLVDSISADKTGAATAGVVKFVYDYAQGLSNMVTVLNANVSAMTDAMQSSGQITIVQGESAESWTKWTALSNEVTYLESAMESMSNILKRVDTGNTTLINMYSSFTAMYNTKFNHYDAFVNNFYNSYSDTQSYVFFLNDRLTTLSNAFWKSTGGEFTAMSNDVYVRLGTLSNELGDLYRQTLSNNQGWKVALESLTDASQQANTELYAEIYGVKQDVQGLSNLMDMQIADIYGLVDGQWDVLSSDVAGLSNQLVGFGKDADALGELVASLGEDVQVLYGLCNLVDELIGVQNGQAEVLGGVEARVVGLETDVAVVRGDVATVGRDVNALQARFDAHEVALVGESNLANGCVTTDKLGSNLALGGLTTCCNDMVVCGTLWALGGVRDLVSESNHAGSMTRTDFVGQLLLPASGGVSMNALYGSYGVDGLLARVDYGYEFCVEESSGCVSAMHVVLPATLVACENAWAPQVIVKAPGTTDFVGRGGHRVTVESGGQMAGAQVRVTKNANVLTFSPGEGCAFYPGSYTALGSMSFWIRE